MKELDQLCQVALFSTALILLIFGTQSIWEGCVDKYRDAALVFLDSLSNN